MNAITELPQEVRGIAPPRDPSGQYLSTRHIRPPLVPCITLCGGRAFLHGLPNRELHEVEAANG